MIPEIKNSDGTERQVRGIPRTSDESVYNKCSNLRDEFIGFIDPKYKNLKLKDIKMDCALKAEWQCSNCSRKWVAVVECRAKNGQSCPFCCK